LFKNKTSEGIVVDGTSAAGSAPSLKHISDLICLLFGGSVEMELISFLVVLAAINRRAQIPFSWLPAAMAAPTPASALVHFTNLFKTSNYVMLTHYLHPNAVHPTYQDLVLFYPPLHT
jgi:NADH:ubiquinone oxidoreductase subunit 5 (subunit L)/multisubunit Na+/H+ antiporter MnhA subunit